MTLTQKKQPAFLIAAIGSNSGKTSITLGVIRALCKKGIRVQPFKCGPDYLDPSYLAQAAGRPCYNLDSWMMGEQYVKESFLQKSQFADVAIIEGAMGLFDGASATTEAGTAAHISRILDIPILLVLDISGMGRSAAAVVHGCCSFTDDIHIAGVIGNRCGSGTHETLIRDALSAAHLPPLLGAILKDALPPIPSRHLGLTMCSSDQEKMIEAIADVVAQQIDLPALLQTLNIAKGNTEPFAGSDKISPGHHLTLAVARDDAFQFVYQDNMEALARNGATLSYFSPLRDKSLPKADALYLPGGYPELHLKALSDNASLRQEIFEFHQACKPIYAECGGLMYLGEHILDAQGAPHSMCGVLPIDTCLRTKGKTLAYSDTRLLEPCHFGKPGDMLKGHRFHYSQIVAERFRHENWTPAYEVHHPGRNETIHEGYLKNNTLASYVHLHWASTPGASASFIDFCRRRQ